MNYLPYPCKQKIYRKQSAHHSTEHEAYENYKYKNKREKKTKHIIYKWINKIFDYIIFSFCDIINHLVTSYLRHTNYQAFNSMSRKCLHGTK